DRVIDELEDHVMEARQIIGIADVHAGPLADGLEPLQELDGISGVGSTHGIVFREWGTASGRPVIEPALTSKTWSVKGVQRPVSETVVKSSVSTGGRADRKPSTQRADKPASNSSAEKRGFPLLASASACHSASLASMTVRWSSPAEASAASGRPRRVQRRSSRCGPASVWPRACSTRERRSSALRSCPASSSRAAYAARISA